MKTPKTPEDLLRALEAIYSKAKTPLAVKAAKHRADPIIKAWVQTIPPGGREQFGARPFFREWAERQVERLETLALDRLAEGQTPEDKSGFEFKPGLALYNGKDLGLPTGLAIDVLRRLVESWGEVVPYSTVP